MKVKEAIEQLNVKEYGKPSSIEFNYEELKAGLTVSDQDYEAVLKAQFESEFNRWINCEEVQNDIGYLTKEEEEFWKKEFRMK